MNIRIQKIMSARGIASRRAAEEMIRAGRVMINGTVAAVGQRANPDSDEITVDGLLLSGAQEMVYIMLNKPRGYVTTMADTHGRPTVAELTAGVGLRLYPVGRLDMDSEGLLLMTNDGDAAYRLTHPSHEVKKTYIVEATGTWLSESAAKMSAIREINGESVRPARVTVLESGKMRLRLSIAIGEGRKRQVRNLCAMCGLTVKRLTRVSEGELLLGDLKPGQWRYLSDSEVDYIRSI